MSWKYPYPSLFRTRRVEVEPHRAGRIGAEVQQGLRGAHTEAPVPAAAIEARDLLRDLRGRALDADLGVGVAALGAVHDDDARATADGLDHGGDRDREIIAVAREIVRDRLTRAGVIVSAAWVVHVVPGEAHVLPDAGHLLDVKGAIVFRGNLHREGARDGRRRVDRCADLLSRLRAHSGLFGAPHGRALRAENRLDGAHRDAVSHDAGTQTCAGPGTDRVGRCRELCRRKDEAHRQCQRATQRDARNETRDRAKDFAEHACALAERERLFALRTRQLTAHKALREDLRALACRARVAAEDRHRDHRARHAFASIVGTFAGFVRPHELRDARVVPGQRGLAEADIHAHLNGRLLHAMAVHPGAIHAAAVLDEDLHAATHKTRVP